MRDLITNIIFIAIVFTIGMVAGSSFRSCSHQPGGSIDTIETITIKTDTIWMDTIFIPVPGEPAQLISQEEPAGQDLHTFYDTVRVFTGLNKIRRYHKSFNDTWAKINAEIRVHGYLMDLRIEYANLKPDILQTKTIERTVIKREPQRGVFIGAQGGSDVLTGAGYLTKKGWFIQYNYAPFTQGHYLGIYKKLF